MSAGTRIGPQTGACLACGTTAAIVNYGTESYQTGRVWEVGYLARHTRPGTRAGSKCRGSWGGWVGQQRGVTRRAFQVRTA